MSFICHVIKGSYLNALEQFCIHLFNYQTRNAQPNKTLETATLFWPCLRHPIATRHCMKHYIIYFEPVFLTQLQYNASYQNIHLSFSWYSMYIQLSSYLYIILIWIFVIIFHFIISMSPFRTFAILLRYDIHIIWTSSVHLLRISWYPQSLRTKILINLVSNLCFIHACFT